MRKYKRAHRPDWWDNETTWMTAADILASGGPWALIVLALALIVSAL